MKIALAQLDYHVGNFEDNTKKIIEHINKAKAEGADIVTFAELAICGYPPWDFVEFRHFIEQCEESIKKIATHCNGICAIIGSPTINPEVKGKDLYNSAYILYDGKIQDVVHKTLLPTYDIFDEYRYFEPNTKFKCIEYKGCKIALTICEDLWNINENPLYISNPMDELIKEKPDFAINIAASPFSFTHDEKRTKVLLQNATNYNLPFFYVNHIGAQTELIFDGASTVALPSGKVYKMPVFEETMQVYDVEEVKKGIGASIYQPIEKMELIYLALVEGIGDYFRKLGFKKAVLGLSGGVDSALVYALAVKALGKENVLPVLMPSPYTSDASNADALDMINRLGTDHKIIPIKTIMEAYDTTLEPHFEGRKKDIAEENIQARVRGALLMALANKFGLILLNTSNKSEMSVGYSTIYGDSIGGISVLGDVYKTEVFQLCDYINKREGDIIPENIIRKPPSAELRPDQKDSDSLPAYEVLDPILFQYIEQRQGPRELIAMGNDSDLVYRILKLVNTAEYKRFQAPPILRVSDKAFGVGRRLPIVGKYLS